MHSIMNTCKKESHVHHHHLNEIGEIIVWKYGSKDDRFLRSLFENKIITDQTPYGSSAIRQDYKQFMKYSPSTFRNALTEVRMQYKNELLSHINSQNIRKVSFIDPQTTHSSKNMTTYINLPYIVDVWTGHNLRKHVSIQVKLLFDDTDNIQYFLSSDRKRFIITYNTKTKPPHDLTIGVIDVVIQRQIEEKKLDAKHNEQLKESLKYHPRVIARLVSDRQNGPGNNPLSDMILEQHIALPFRCEIATIEHDKYFYGIDIVRSTTDDSLTVSLHIELIDDIGHA